MIDILLKITTLTVSKSCCWRISKVLSFILILLLSESFQKTAYKHHRSVLLWHSLTKRFFISTKKKNFCNTSNCSTHIIQETKNFSLNQQSEVFLLNTWKQLHNFSLFYMKLQILHWHESYLQHFSLIIWS